MNRDSSIGVETANRVRNASRAGAITAVICTFSAAAYSYMGWQLGAWQLHALAGLSLALALAAALGVGLSRRGRPEPGMELMIGVGLAACVVVITLLNGLGVMIGAITVAFTALVSGYTLPPARANRAILVSA